MRRPERLGIPLELTLPMRPDHIHRLPRAPISINVAIRRYTPILQCRAAIPSFREAIPTRFALKIACTARHLPAFACVSAKFFHHNHVCSPARPSANRIVFSFDWIDKQTSARPSLRCADTGGTTQPRGGTWVNVSVTDLFPVSRRAVELPRLVQAWV